MKKLVLLLVLLSSNSFADNAARCEGYQFVPGTPEFGNCMMQLDQQAAQMEMQRRAAMMQMYRPIVIPQSTYNYQIPNQQTNCRWIGSVWNCR